VKKIEKSIENLFANLEEDFKYLIKRKVIFGSYDRDTILPRIYDKHSDVDIMIIFKTVTQEYLPETYRSWLKTFADKYYHERYGSEVVRSSPTVTIRLNNINYDLVPAKETDYQYVPNKIYIPSKGSNEWQITDPDDIKNKLTEANKKYNQIVRLIIRLLKAWNSYNDYPYDSYDLELKITEMNFYQDNVESGLFWAADRLSALWNDSQLKKDKIASLKYNIGKVKEALNQDDLYNAKKWLHKVLPE